MRGNVPKYLRLLTLFADSHAPNVTRLGALLAAGERASMAELAHTLKGAAGAIGATRVSETAAALVTTLRAHAGNEEIAAHCAALIAELNSLIEAVRSVARAK